MNVVLSFFNKNIIIRKEMFKVKNAIYKKVRYTIIGEL
jgi:hypothetical protein